MHRKGSVAIVGAGWLGFPLGEHLVERGYTVYASTTSPEKLAKIEAAGMHAALIDLPLANLTDGPQPQSEAAAKLWTADQLVLDVPPQRSADAEHTYPAKILSAVLAYRRAQSAGRIIFCSSTGIYGDATGTVTVNTPIEGKTARVRALALAESQVLTQSQRPVTILRLGGLIGGDRHPGRYFAGKSNIPDGDAPVNVVHRSRVIETITEFLDEPFWQNSIHNVVDPEHPSKKEFYTAFARKEGVPLPHFLPGGANWKIVK